MNCGLWHFYASKGPEYEQIRFVIRLLIENLEANSIFYIIIWMSHRFKRPVSSTPAVKCSVLPEAIDEADIIANA